MKFFDWCFPELLYWEVSEYSEGIVSMYFITSYKQFSISITCDNWEDRDEKQMHFKKIKLCHRILTGATE